MKNVDDGPDGLNDDAFDRACSVLPRTKKIDTDAVCAKGDCTAVPGGGWQCRGCGRLFVKSPNQHIYAARRRVRQAVAS